MAQVTLDVVQARYYDKLRSRDFSAAARLREALEQQGGQLGAPPADVQAQYYDLLRNSDFAGAARLREALPSMGEPTADQQAIADQARELASKAIYAARLAGQDDRVQQLYRMASGAGVKIRPANDTESAKLRDAALTQMTSGMPMGQQFLANAGAHFTSAGRGIKQALYDPIADRLFPNPAGSPSRVEQSREAQKQTNANQHRLGQTFGGFLGGAGAEAAMMAPTLMIPGALESRLAAGAVSGTRALATRAAVNGATGLTAGFLAPTTAEGQRATNTIAGGLLAPAGELGGAAVGAAVRGGSRAASFTRDMLSRERSLARAGRSADDTMLDMVSPEGAAPSAWLAAEAQLRRRAAGEAAVPGYTPNVGEALLSPDSAMVMRRVMSGLPEGRTVLANAASRNNAAIERALSREALATPRPMAAAGETGVDAVLDRAPYLAAKKQRDDAYAAFRDANASLPDREAQYQGVADELQRGFFGPSQGPGLMATTGPAPNTGAAGILGFTPEEADLARTMVARARAAGTRTSAVRPRPAYGALDQDMAFLAGAHPELKPIHRRMMATLNEGMLDSTPYRNLIADAAERNSGKTAGSLLQQGEGWLGDRAFPPTFGSESGMVPAGTLLDFMQSGSSAQRALASRAAGSAAAAPVRGEAGALYKAMAPLREQLDRDIPGFLAAQRAYREASAPLNTADIFQDALRAGLGRGRDVTGHMQLSLPMTGKLARELQDRENVTVSGQELGAALNRLAQDRDSALKNIGAGGSNTFSDRTLAESASRKLPDLVRYAAWKPSGLLGAGALGLAFGGLGAAQDLGYGVVGPVGALGTSLLAAGMLRKQSGRIAAAEAERLANPRLAADAMRDATIRRMKREVETEIKRKRARVRGVQAGRVVAAATRPDDEN